MIVDSFAKNTGQVNQKYQTFWQPMSAFISDFNNHHGGPSPQRERSHARTVLD